MSAGNASGESAGSAADHAITLGEEVLQPAPVFKQEGVRARDFVGDVVVEKAA